MILHFLIYTVVATDEKGRLERGAFFHGETIILLAEKFVNAQFLVPYAKFDIQLTENLDKIITEVQNMWRKPTYRCYFNFTNTSENDFKLDWLLKGTKMENLYADNYLNKIKRSILLLEGHRNQEKTYI